MDQRPEPDDGGLPARLARLISLLLMLWAVWEQIPEHRRTAWRLAVLRAAREGCWRAASAMGRSAMRAELSGAGQAYQLPLVLAQLADRAATAYDRTRGAL